MPRPVVVESTTVEGLGIPEVAAAAKDDSYAQKDDIPAASDADADAAAADTSNVVDEAAAEKDSAVVETAAEAGAEWVCPATKESKGRRYSARRAAILTSFQVNWLVLQQVSVDALGRSRHSSGKPSTKSESSGDIPPFPPHPISPGTSSQRVESPGRQLSKLEVPNIRCSVTRRSIVVQSSLPGSSHWAATMGRDALPPVAVELVSARRVWILVQGRHGGILGAASCTLSGV